MRILVTGDSGMIGSHLTKSLVKHHKVFGISRSSRNLVEGVKRYQFDLRNKELTDVVVSEINPEVVFHLAANAAEGASVFSPIEITTTGINTFLNVLVPAIKTGKLKKFNFTSSIAVYGPITTPFREQDLPLPQDIYGVAKLSIERMLKIMADVHGFKYSITRPHNVYGPNQNMSDPHRNVVTLFMNHILMGKPYTIYGDGSMKRAYSYVEDVIEVIARSGMDNKTGLTMNVGANKDYSLQELSEAVQKATKTKIRPNHLPSRVHEVHSAIADHTIANALYGYKSTPFEQGIASTWRYAKRLGPQEYEKRTLEIISEKAPKNWK